jgi:hypothetical protein
LGHTLGNILFLFLSLCGTNHCYVRAFSTIWMMRLLTYTVFKVNFYFMYAFFFLKNILSLVHGRRAPRIQDTSKKKRLRWSLFPDQKGETGIFSEPPGIMGFLHFHPLLYQKTLLHRRTSSRFHFA